MIYVAIAIAVYLAYRLINSYLKFINRSSLAFFADKTLEIREDNPIELAYKHGVLLMLKQDYYMAKQNFEKAAILLSRTEQDYIVCLDKDARTILNLNITFCNKPLPWSNAMAQDKTGSYITYILVDRFGGPRFESYTGLNDDMREAHETMTIARR